jgi:hypothetical protein
LPKLTTRRGVVLRDAQRDVEDVHPVVAEFAVSGVPRPMPVVVQFVAFEWTHRRRSAENIVIQSLRIPRQLVADGGAQVVDDGADVVDFAEFAGMKVLDRGGQARLGAVVRADLDDAVILRGGLDHLAALPHGAAHRLLDVDILPGLAGPDGEERVPVVAGRDQHGVDVRARDQLAGIGGLERRGQRGRQGGGDAGQHLRIDIAQAGDAHPRHLEQILQVGRTLAVEADDAEAHGIVGAGGGGVHRRAKTRGERGAGKGGFLEKRTAGKRGHGSGEEAAGK